MTTNIKLTGCSTESAHGLARGVVGLIEQMQFDGELPSNLKLQSFAELHDHCDANELLIEVVGEMPDNPNGDPDLVQAYCDRCNAVADAFNELIEGGECSL